MKPADARRPEFTDVGAAFGQADVAASLVTFAVGLVALTPRPLSHSRGRGESIDLTAISIGWLGLALSTPRRRRQGQPVDVRAAPARPVAVDAASGSTAAGQP